MNISKKMQNVEGYPSRVGTQILGLIPQSQVRKFLKCASSQIANPQICNDYSANFLCKEKAVFLIQVRSVLPLLFLYLRVRIF